MDADTKLAAARTRLILDKPFLGALALRLPLREADRAWIRSTWSDGESLYFNRAYVDSLSVGQAQFALSREALHCALLHFLRRGNRRRDLWENACDFAINPLLVADGLAPTPDVVALVEFDGLTAEEIYPLLRDADMPPEARRNDGEGDGGGERPPPPAAGERELLAARWRQRLAAAAQQAQQAGKLGAGLARLVDTLLQPRLPWRSVLARYLTATARNDYSYTRPSSRRGDPAVFPGLRSDEIDLVVAVDTSGSIRDAEIGHFFAEINAIKGQIRARIALLCCDAELAEGFPRYYEAWDDFTCEPEVKGGGGTDFRPVFDWVERRDLPPDTLVYFTDARGRFPARAPDYPVLWLVKGREPVPFGARIQLND